MLGAEIVFQNISFVMLRTVRCAFNVPYTVLEGISLQPVTSTFFFLQYATRSSALQLILMPPTNTTLRVIFLPPRRSAGFLWRLAASCTIDQSYLVLTGLSVVRLALLVRGVEKVRLAYVSPRAAVSSPVGADAGTGTPVAGMFVAARYEYSSWWLSRARLETSMGWWCCVRARSSSLSSEFF